VLIVKSKLPRSAGGNLHRATVLRAWELTSQYLFVGVPIILGNKKAPMNATYRIHGGFSVYGNSSRFLTGFFSFAPLYKPF